LRGKYYLNNKGELEDMEGKIRGRTTAGNSWTNGGE
jgi:hypothetical protein